jgi:hypothetical protein
MRHTAAVCFPSTNKAVSHRGEVDAHSAGQGGTRASPAGSLIVWQSVDALRLPAMAPTWLPANSGENRGDRDGGRNLGIWAPFREPAPNLWPVWYDSVGAGAEAIEADT